MNFYICLQLKVLVLYESLCPDSVRFMQRQLGPSYDLIKDYIDITLVPFGKSIVGFTQLPFPLFLLDLSIKF